MEPMQPQFTAKIQKSHRLFVLRLLNATVDRVQVLEKLV